MALINCRECSKEISNEAEKCPHCGAARKQSHGLRTITLIAFIALVGIWIYSIMDQKNPKTPRGYLSMTTDQVLASTKLKSMRWWRDGFDTILMADFTIENNSKHGLRDFEVQCSGYAPSGTRIDGNKQVIYETIEPGKSKSFKKVNMGFLHGQVQTLGCTVSKIVLVPNFDVLTAEAGPK